jgi:hypothetical protein
MPHDVLTASARETARSCDRSVRNPCLCCLLASSDRLFPCSFHLTARYPSCSQRSSSLYIPYYRSSRPAFDIDLG